MEALDLALNDADIPTLLMVLIQLTGDTNWLSPRFQCLRVRGLTDDGTGGLGEDICAEIIAAAHTAILRWRSRTAPAPAVLPHEVLADMMRINTGEEIPAGYGAIIAAGLGHDEAFSLHRKDRFKVPEDFRVLIIGAGIAGLCAAIRLENAGVPYLVIEKNATIGGTWHENRYPGAGVDTPSHIYSYSFAKHDWTMTSLPARNSELFRGRRRQIQRPPADPFQYSVSNPRDTTTGRRGGSFAPRMTRNVAGIVG